MSKAIWLIDNIMEEKHKNNYEQYPSLEETAKKLGYETHILKYPGFGSPIELPPSLTDKEKNYCIVAHGSKVFCNQIKKIKNFIPGVYYGTENGKEFSVSHWTSHMDHNTDYFNHEYIILPYGIFEKRYLNVVYNSKDDLWKDKGNQGVFIRPNSTHKSFTGKVLPFNIEDSKIELKTLQTINNIHCDELIVVAPPKDIKGEFRFIIGNNKVITGSEYRWNKKLDIRSDIHPRALKMAKNIAHIGFNPDKVFTLDIVIDYNDIPWIMEYNPFSSSGLYLCDMEKIVTKVSDLAEIEFKEGNY